MIAETSGNTNNDGTICSGASITLTANGGIYSYNWTSPVVNGASFSPAATATYTVTVTDGNSCTATKTVTVTFLEMHDKQELPQPLAHTFFNLLLKPISAKEYRTWYYGVGEKWFWLDRMVMPDEMLYEKINAANVDLFIFYANNEPAGFAEFVRENKYVEILYFGLLPGFIGKGLGNYFLQWVIAHAWSYQPEWIQLNTCTLDHPNALSVYKKAGFRQVKTAMEERKVLV